MKSANLVVITDLIGLTKLKEYISDKEYIAYDTETTGLAYDAEVIGFSVCADPDLAFYVALSRWDKSTSSLVPFETKQHAASFISELTSKSLIMHNAVFDCRVTRLNFGVELMPSVHTDTLILGQLLNENRSNGLKDLGVSIYGDSAKKEQAEMKASIVANEGKCTREHYELYKADYDLIGKYGAKDAALTLSLFYEFIPQLFEQKLDKFFFEEESMPLLRGPTYELNSFGLKLDTQKLQDLKGTIEAECLEMKAYIYDQIKFAVKDKYPGTSKSTTFNIGSSEQMAWLLYSKLGNEFNTLTDTGRDICKFLGQKLPYTNAAKRDFIKGCEENIGQIYQDVMINPKTNKLEKAKTIKAVWKYLKCDKEALSKLASKYKWVATLLEYNKAQKILKTYVVGMQSRANYGIIRPSFLQHGTTSGRYSSRDPNFQNLPRNDKRIKDCIISRPGKVFVGADYSQLEPRVFASASQDQRLMDCFKNGDDFYSVIGMEVFNRKGCSLKKSDANSFANLYPKERDIAKVVALSSTYGTTAPKMAPTIKKSIKEAQDIIDRYFASFPSVHRFMMESHEIVKSQGYVQSIYGRIRRMPQALEIKEIYGDSLHSELPYDIRNVLNLAVNHRVQSTGASIVNRASIAFCNKIKELGYKEVNICLQVHDEIVLECPTEIAPIIAKILKDCMENTVILPGVTLEAEPKIGKTLAELK